MSRAHELLAEADRLRRAGHLADAERTCRLAVATEPNNPAAHNLLGRILGTAGSLAEAEACFHRAIAIDPAFVDAHGNLGVALQMQSRLPAAAEAYRRAIAWAPNTAELHRKLAGVLEELGARDEAVAVCQRAVELDPNHADAQNSLGVLLERQHRLDDAVAALRKAVALRPEFAQAHSNLGAALEAQGKLDEAAAALARAIELNPNCVEPHVNLSLVLERQGRFEEALAAIARATALDPNCAAAHVNRGLVLERQGKLAEAAAAFRQALDVDPECSEAHLNYGLIRLRDGDFAEGWTHYEWRFRCEGAVEPVRGEPRWRGESIAGRRILLCEEQGYGDTLQFVRFAEQLKMRGAEVVVECRAELAELLASCRHVDTVVVRGTPLPACDVHVPLASLPGLLGTTLEAIPADVPYLFANGARAAQWKQELKRDGDLRVGIAWQGNPQNKTDRFRSVPLACFARLAEVKGLRLFSLQLGAGSEQLPSSPLRSAVADLADRIRDFSDTAAIMANLDLVISCDSSPAHLAGALGVPVWVPLASIADWRYLHDRDDSPWYPTMRLYRQARVGGWDGVFERIAGDLAARVSESRSGSG